MAKRPKAEFYKEAVVQGGAVKAVRLDSKARERSLATEVCKELGRLHRCDYYKVVKAGKVRCLFLIEDTSIAGAVEGLQTEFSEAMKQFLALLINHKVQQEELEAANAYEIFSDFIFRRLYEEHAAKAHSTLIILEKIREEEEDNDLICMLSYEELYYILIIKDADDPIVAEGVIKNMQKRFGSTLIGEERFFCVSEKDFDDLIQSKIARQDS